ncbi:MAG: Fic family protein [Clostridia bacterium]|nr:Fic family protein [Clostridia bacterium]
MDDYEKALALWQHKHVTTDAELDEALSSYRISFAYHSGNLENDRITYDDTREIFEHDRVISYTGVLRTLLEIRNAKDAYELFLQSFHDRRSLDEDLVKEFQKCLTLNTYDARRHLLGERPGEYKRHDYVTGKHEIGAAPKDVSDEMRKLLDELHGIPTGGLLRAASYYPTHR